MLNRWVVATAAQEINFARCTLLPRLAATAIQLELQLAPWAQTHAFLEAIRPENKLFLALDAGAGGTGLKRRGLIFHYAKKPPKKNQEKDRPGPRAHERVRESARGGSDVCCQQRARGLRRLRLNSSEPSHCRPCSRFHLQITGTSADLRTLKKAETKALLLSYNFTEAEIEKIKRWKRIDLIRKCNAAAMADKRIGENKWLRQTRETQQESAENQRKSANALYARMVRVPEQPAARSPPHVQMGRVAAEAHICIERHSSVVCRKSLPTHSILLRPSHAVSHSRASLRLA